MMQAGKHQTAYLAAFWKEIEQEGALLRERALPPLLEKDFFLFEETVWFMRTFILRAESF